MPYAQEMKVIGDGARPVDVCENTEFVDASRSVFRIRAR